jgi:hypothetical protein
MRNSDTGRYPTNKCGYPHIRNQPRQSTTEMQVSAIVGQECPRLRPFKVGGIEIPTPANEHWYQNKEAVRVILEVRKRGAMLEHVVDVRERHLLDNYALLGSGVR